ncbi:MAG: tRNA lysidine(34) synthetase TilS [Mesorhizobium sp.]|nr:tRNA lysidine(34) synthetase TilS [Mesorhizobium sp.]
MLTALPALDPARLFAGIDFASSPTVLVAVSGGGDSIALLSLLARHLPPSRLAAVTIDHALRPGSTAEAEDVGRFCRNLGIRHSISTWEGPKPATGLSATAREARYRLLAQAARDLGATMLFAGHTEDDQAETVAMRAERGEGRGLAGMAPATLLDGRLWLMRPLLGVRREALRDYLRMSGIGWADDPTNEDEAYERVRIRRRLADPAAFADAIRISEQAGQERARLGQAAADLIAAAASPVPGLIQVDPAAFLAADRAAAVYALRLLLATAGGTGQPPDEGRAAALLEKFGDPALRASLSRSTVERRRDVVYLRREARGLPEPHVAVDGEIWDGRFRLGNVEGRTVAPVGHAGRGADEAADVPPALARAATATRPALFNGEECLGLLPGRADTDQPPPRTPPHKGEGESEASAPPSPLWGGVRGGGIDTGEGDGTAEISERPPASVIGPPGMSPSPGRPFATPVAAPFARILPSFDLAPARALARLIGGELPPPSPYAGHSAPRP